MWLKICFLGLGVVLFLISAACFAIGAVFTRFPGKTDRAPGRLVKYKYKKDVPVYKKKVSRRARSSVRDDPSSHSGEVCVHRKR